MYSELKHSAVVIVATRVGTIHLIDNMVLEQYLLQPFPLSLGPLASLVWKVPGSFWTIASGICCL
jgi:hypothetical protein